MSVICVNSTVPARRAMQQDAVLSPLHHWGYVPGANDMALAHRLNRFEITLRARLGGVDPWVLWRTWRGLARGARAVFLVTQPDLLRALPWLRRRFPDRRLVAWIWMDWEVDLHLDALRACDHVLCLTPGAQSRLAATGLGARASFVLWGAAPDYYQTTDRREPDADVLIAGITGRDTALLQAGIDLGRYRVCLSRFAARPLRTGPREILVDLDTQAGLLAAQQRCRVAWIPTLAQDRYPSGLTNLVESLLGGMAVVVPRETRIPEPYLTLPGVFRHRAGDAVDFLRQTDAALSFARQPGARELIARAAAAALAGADLRATVRQGLGLPG